MRTLIRILLTYFILILFSQFTFGKEIQIGAASKVINNKVGGWVQGAGVPKRASKIRDNLEANALYLSDGKTQLLIFSCDIVGLETPFVAELREKVGKASNVPPRNVIITCTHTHGGPSLVRTNYLMPLDHEYMDQLTVWLCELGVEAVSSAKPGKVGWGVGEAAIGFNRRLCWANGTHTMHGDAKRPDFAGLEGPEDHQHLALMAVDKDEKPLAVLYHNTTHPTIFYAAGIYSSDFVSEARSILRKEFGEIPVLYLNGAQGDIAMEDQLNKLPESREARLKRIGKLAADETLRLCKDMEFHSKPILQHTFEDLQVKVQLPTGKELEQAKKVLARIDRGEKIRGMGMIMAFGAANLYERFAENPVDTLPIHAIRIGDVALVTQPCELYCQFGLDIKRRSQAPITAVVGMADGYGGYCPTIYGILGGGYSGAPISWRRLEPNAGYLLVESAGKLLNKLWRNDQ